MSSRSLRNKKNKIPDKAASIRIETKVSMSLFVKSSLENRKIAEEIASKNVKAIKKMLQKCAENLETNCDATGMMKTSCNAKLLFSNCSVALSDECDEQVLGVGGSKLIERIDKDLCNAETIEEERTVALKEV